MKINAKICPKGCKVDKTQRQRMTIITQNRAVPYGTRYRKEILLNWHCPQCGYSMPVSMQDVRRESRYKKSTASIPNARARER